MQPKPDRARKVDRYSHAGHAGPQLLTHYPSLNGQLHAPAVSNTWPMRAPKELREIAAGYYAAKLEKIQS